MTTTLKNLPPEILQQVSYYLRHDHKNIRECILVCSSWRNLYQKLLYSSVKLHRFSQILKLVDTLKNSSRLSRLIEEMSFASNFNICYNNRTEVETATTLFTLLSNLKYVDMPFTSGMKCLLDALLAKQLPCLNRIEPSTDEEELGYYTTCALLLKNCLENLSIVDFTVYQPRNSDEHNEIILRQNRGSLLFHRLYDRLNEFTRIKDLRLATRTNNDIYWLEKVTECCPLLESLDMTFGSTLEASTVVQIQNIIPAPKVRQLAFGRIHFYSPLFTKYIASKFPSLESLEIYDRINHTAHFSKAQFKDFLDYLSNIKRVEIFSIPFEEQFFVDTIGPFWEAMTISRTRSIHLSYDEDEDSNVHDFSVEFNDSRILLDIRYPGSANAVDFLNMITNYGKCIESLTINKETRILLWTNSYDLLFEPLKYCLNLKEFAIYGNPFIGLNTATQTASRRETFDSLRFHLCTMESSDVLENLSRVFSYIKELKFHGLQFDTKNSSPINIHLSETNIGSLLFDTRLFFTKHRKYHKLLVKLTAGHIHGCYVFDDMFMAFKCIDYQHFSSVFEQGESVMFDFKFKSIKSVTIRHFHEEIKVPL